MLPPESLSLEALAGLSSTACVARNSTHLLLANILFAFTGIAGSPPDRDAASKMPASNGLEGGFFVQTEKKPKPRTGNPFPAENCCPGVCKYKS